MKKIGLILTLLCSWVSGNSQTVESSVVKGTISDSLGAVITGATVKFENQAKVVQATTSHTGEYSIALPPGVYGVSVDAILGFERLQRSAIKVEPKTTRTLNIEMAGKFTIFLPYENTNMELVDHPYTRSIGYTYEEISGLSEIGVKSAKVSFATRCEAWEFLTFNSSPFDPREGARVTFTYDFLTATAYEFRFSRKTKGIVACGNVSIEVDGEKKKFKDCAAISVKNGKAQIAEIE